MGVAPFARVKSGIDGRHMPCIIKRSKSINPEALTPLNNHMHLPRRYRMQAPLSLEFPFRTEAIQTTMNIDRYSLKEKGL